MSDGWTRVDVVDRLSAGCLSSSIVASHPQQLGLLSMVVCQSSKYSKTARGQALMDRGILISVCVALADVSGQSKSHGQPLSKV